MDSEDRYRECFSMLHVSADHIYMSIPEYHANYYFFFLIKYSPFTPLSTGLAPPPPAAPWLPNHALTCTRTFLRIGINSKTTFGFLMLVPSPLSSFLPSPVDWVQLSLATTAWRTPMWGLPPQRGSSWSAPGSKCMFILLGLDYMMMFDGWFGI